MWLAYSSCMNNMCTKIAFIIVVECHISFTDSIFVIASLTHGWTRYDDGVGVTQSTWIDL